MCAADAADARLCMPAWCPQVFAPAQSCLSARSLRCALLLLPLLLPLPLPLPLLPPPPLLLLLLPLLPVDV